jgi:hypothetical protein
MNDELAPVRLIDFPVALATRFNRHYEAIQRELALIHFSDDETRAALPGRVLAVAERASGELAGAEIIAQDQLSEAITGGAQTITLDALMPRSVGESITALLAVLSEADAFCRQGDLITVAMPPECCRFRDWFLNELVNQMRGEEPTPWTGPFD